MYVFMQQIHVHLMFSFIKMYGSQFLLRQSVCVMSIFICLRCSSLVAITFCHQLYTPLPVCISCTTFISVMPISTFCLFETKNIACHFSPLCTSKIRCRNVTLQVLLLILHIAVYLRCTFTIAYL